MLFTTALLKSKEKQKEIIHVAFLHLQNDKTAQNNKHDTFLIMIKLTQSDQHIFTAWLINMHDVYNDYLDHVS